ncbi:nucleoside-diphosphate kinase [candidate division KSB3 bacterium]|uniref:Nucleoside diphosphate kinase n=1 Tax=candidate division KSB3 bacterium TaxID=2044937 RepID=A0A9D5JT06_9BACT|nr:nucleoside-diphosphate kinase [candidate division KSB3 bacterium]MBD3323081.1 nucleoside-diphosphate kinase [candidate division KSB3 bacterium]
MMERTLIIIKPDAIVRGHAGEILTRFEHAGFKILAMRMLTLTKRQARKFYAEHDGKPFFEKLTLMMSSSPIIAAVLAGDNAIAHARELMGATDPAEAAEGTIRKDYALDGTQNSVHGSDCLESAAREIPFFFPALDICQVCDQY